jgi:hypothetical protein
MTASITRLIRCAAVAALAASIAGCVTMVSGGVAEPGSNGLRYHLPQPVLLVSPQADGTLTVSKELIPDESKTYYLRASSFLGSYTFDVSVSNGLLSSVNMKSDATQVASNGIEAAQSVREARIKADRAEEAEAEKESGTAAAAIAAAEAAVREAQKAYDVAVAVRGRIEEPGETDAEEAADVAIIRAQHDLDAANEELARLLGAPPPAPNPTPGPGPAPAPSPVADGPALNADVADGAALAHPASTLMAWGPVVYTIEQSIVDGLPTVRLVQAQWSETTLPTPTSGQIAFRTATSALPPDPAPTPVDFRFADSSVIRPVDGLMRFKLTASRKIDRLSGPYPHGRIHASGADNAAKVADATLTLIDDSSTVTVDLPGDLPRGTYSLRFDYLVDNDPAARTTAMAFRVER